MGDAWIQPVSASTDTGYKQVQVYVYPEYRPSEVSGIRVPSADTCTNPFGGHARIRVRLCSIRDLCATGTDPEPLLVPPLPLGLGHYFDLKPNVF